MERKLASIQKITNIRPHNNADKLELANVLGWQVVVKKGEFKENDLIIYCEVDSVLPDVPIFEFLRDKHFRIKTIRLRGEISQGICFPLSTINPVSTILNLGEEGADLTELLGIKKWEPAIPVQLAGTVIGNFPSFIPKTDETRIQAVPEVLNRHRGKTMTVTEKIDGTSVTYFVRDDKFGVCSRNLQIKETEENLYWQMAKRGNIEHKLRAVGHNVALQAEIAGMGVQGNKLKRLGVELYAFDVFDIDAFKYLNPDEFVGFCRIHEIETVPIITENLPLIFTVDELVTFATRKSLITPSELVEGVVFRPSQETKDEELGRLSFKVINPEFLIKHKE